MLCSSRSTQTTELEAAVTALKAQLAAAQAASGGHGNGSGSGSSVARRLEDEAQAAAERAREGLGGSVPGTPRKEQLAQQGAGGSSSNSAQAKVNVTEVGLAASRACSAAGAGVCGNPGAGGHGIASHPVSEEPGQDGEDEEGCGEEAEGSAPGGMGQGTASTATPRSAGPQHLQLDDMAAAKGDAAKVRVHLLSMISTLKWLAGPAQTQSSDTPTTLTETFAHRPPRSMRERQGSKRACGSCMRRWVGGVGGAWG